MTTLREIIIEHVGADKVGEIIFASTGYCDITLESEAPLVGTCEDGDNRANVYAPVCGGYHVSSQSGGGWSVDEPEDFQPTIREGA